jgi:hypothetical protein
MLLPIQCWVCFLFNVGDVVSKLFNVSMFEVIIERRVSHALRVDPAAIAGHRDLDEGTRSSSAAVRQQRLRVDKTPKHCERESRISTDNANAISLPLTWSSSANHPAHNIHHPR